MPAPGIPREKYDSMVILFRGVASAAGGVANVGRNSRYNTVGAQVGVAKETAKRAWEVGWPDLNLPSIRGVLAREEIAARAERQRREDERKRAAKEQKRREVELLQEERRQAARDLVKSRAALGELTKNAIAGAGVLVRMLINLQPGISKLTQDLTKELLDDRLSFKERIDTMKAISSFSKNMATMSVYAARLEERVMSAPPIPDLQESTEQLSTQELVAQMKEFIEVMQEGEGCDEYEDELDD